jgi:diacylglycerol kinase
MELPEKKRFSIIARFKSLTHAFRGIRIYLQTQHNARLQVLSVFLVVAAGFYFSISPVEWALVILSIMAVMVTEAINTAIEIDINLTSPEYHPYARDTKDVAAGAVALAMLGALVVGLLIFLPKIIAAL